MSKELVNAREIAKEYGLFLKVVTSMKSFETYNAFYNIFGECEEPCRRIVVLTPYENLEEVEDENPSEPVSSHKIIDGTLWLEEHPLIKNPKNIYLSNIMVNINLVKNLKVKEETK